ncbi:MAG: copper resistance protein CopC [Dehalococcoidia bacterium]|nr:copper resistance protein CopC [Dehalococcoidia bacterium]
MTRRVLLVFVAALLVVMLRGSTDAEAHAALLRSEPAANAYLQRAPGEITLVFSEPVDLRVSEVHVLDAAGLELILEPLQLGADGFTLRQPLPQLEPGIYNVLWANVSRVDGHGLRGSYPFTVLNRDGSLPDQVNSVGGLGSDPDPAPEAEGVAVRSLSLLGLLLVAGPAVLLLLGVGNERARRGLSSTMLGGAVVLAIGTALNLEVIRDTFQGQGLRDLLFETRTGGYWLTRAGAVMLVAVLTTFIGDSPKRTSAGVLAVTGVYLWSYSATSHAAAGTGSAWSTGFDLVHASAAIVWIGAVIALAVTARLAWRSASYAELMGRFGLLASVMVFVLLATGVLNSLAQIDAFDKLWETRYGVTLLAKLALMAPLLLVGLYNAKRAKRRLISGAPGEPRRFLVSATGEAALGVAVFALAAMLTQTSVSKSVIDEPNAQLFDQLQPAGDLDVQLTVDPNRTGINTFRARVTLAGVPVGDVQRVRLSFRYQDDQTVGVSTLVLGQTDTGTFSGQGPYLPLEGNWRIEAEVRRPNADDVIAFFDVRPGGAAVNYATTGGAWDNPAPGLSWNEFGGLVAVLFGLGLALFKGQIPLRDRRATWAATGATAFGFGFGALLLFGVHGHEPSPDIPTNPVFPDENSLTQGRELYQQNCIGCHGRTGVPPVGLNVDPYPLDLTVHAPQHPDGVLYNFIADGVPGSAMRAWGSGDGALSEEQIWHLVNYLRTLGAADE